MSIGLQTLTTKDQSDKAGTGMKDVIETFSDILETPVIIAGGAVRDYLRNEPPKDYDVFMLGRTWEDWEDYKAQFAERFDSRMSQFPKVESKVEWHKSEPFLLDTILFNGREVQLLASPAKSIPELISDFDWSVCCFGFDGTNYVYDPPDLDSIKHGEYLRLNKCTFPFSTLRRGYRFSERYSMRIKREDINTICRQIMEKTDNEADV